MAGHHSKVIKSLIRYGNTSALNRANLNTWHSEAIEEMSNNKGGQIVNGSTNGSSFGLNPSASIHEWVALLETALDHLERGTKPTNRTIARLC